MILINIENLEFETFFDCVGEEPVFVDYISREKLESMPRVDPVNHAEWQMETKIFSHRPENIHIVHTCSNCGQRERVNIFPVSEWEEYRKYHYDPCLPRFCHDCGCKMDLRDLYEQYKREWCEARGYKLEDMDEETGINGECYTCFNEWYDNEYLKSRGV